MKRRNLPCFILLGTLTWIVQACAPIALPSFEEEHDWVATYAAATLTALSGTSQAGANTLLPQIPTTALFEEPETVQASETASPTITCTSTPEGVFISVSVDTRCRSGPGQDYEQVGALLVGETAEVFGRYPPANYYIIQNPDAEGTCWLWGEYATLIGDVNQLPVITPQPLPVPTSQAFTLYVQFYQLDNCNNLWVLAFEIASPDVGPQGMHSAAATVIDITQNNQLVGEMSSNQAFCLYPCGPCDESSGPGAWTLIVVPVTNPQLLGGDDYLLRLIVCTEDNLQGRCARAELRFRIPGG